MDILTEIANKAKEDSGVKIHRRNVERLLSAVQTESDFWKIVDKADLTVPAAVSIIKMLIEKNLLFIDDKENILLTQAGKDLIEEEGIYEIHDHKCKACDGRGIPFYDDIEIYRTFVQIAKDRPDPIQDYDQGAVTPETTIARVLFLDSRGDLRGKEIMVMGAEDDLTGLAVAMTRKAKRVLILDIDERLIEFDKRIFKELGIDNAEAMVWDLRNPFPEEWIGAFDVFITDPPETVAAFKAFTGRGISLLKREGCAGYFGLTLRDSSLFRWHDFQKELISTFGVVITDIVKDFNHYMNWGYHENTRAAKIAPVKRSPKDIWYRSAWYRIETLPGFKRWNEPIKDEVFYLDEEGSTT